MSSAGMQGETPSRAVRRWRAWVLGGSALIVVALMLASAAGGWWWANRTVVANAQNETSDDPVALVDSTSRAMPDVRGLTRDEASQVLADAGFSADDVRFVDTPSGAPAGTVVAQTPAFGTRGPTEIVVELAVPSTMPDLAGLSRDDAVSALSDLGVAASIDLVYVPGAKTGTITSTSPAAGEPLGSTATITLASPGTERSLGDTRRLSGDCRESGKVSLAGTAHSSSITCATDDEPRTTVWLLGARVDEVEATVGIDDTAKPGTSVAVEVLADGVVVFSGSAAFGAPVKVALPVSGVLQLAVRVGAAHGQTVVFGDPVVRGSTEAITEITS